MEYKRIELLINCYFNAETTLKEERLLRTFFSQEQIPAHLLKYQSLFCYQLDQQAQTLGADFDTRIMNAITAPQQPKQRSAQTLHRLYKIAVAAAIIITVGIGFQVANQSKHQPEFDYESYTDTFEDPEVAYQEVKNALFAVSDNINAYEAKQDSDSLKQDAHLSKDTLE